VDIATIIGAAAGAAIIVVSILIGGTLGAFVNTPGLLIVVGGTMCAAMVAETLPNCLKAVKVAMNAVFNRSPDPEDTIKTIANLSATARRDGLIALENEKVDDGFLARGVRFVVDGMTPEDTRAALSAELFSMKQRHQRGQKLFKFLASTAPSMGMIGTLIGLVQMLRTLSDPSSIGPAMAVALLTTLYGAILAFMMFGPIAEKLGKRSDEEGTNMKLVIEGLEGIAKGDNARVIQEKLEGMLAPQQRSAGSGS
jgi:chemotaxis protein MotA